ncbi:hypothetical protein EVAR_92509_1 [Eumeta japonica]|uniref:Uncharacterized protein n=1 Tax=Eumeta variegata TaxID=151549 RepID=A0A4C1T6E4_EUMVA|nr:hypothetical protein EVAR_92509_1 [Eumeta japonica]
MHLIKKIKANTAEHKEVLLPNRARPPVLTLGYYLFSFLSNCVAGAAPAAAGPRRCGGSRGQTGGRRMRMRRARGITKHELFVYVHVELAAELRSPSLNLSL